MGISSLFIEILELHLDLIFSGTLRGLSFYFGYENHRFVSIGSLDLEHEIQFLGSADLAHIFS